MYAKIENAVKGAYYVIVNPRIDKSTNVGNPPIIINIYGPSSNVKFSDETKALKFN